MEITFLPDTMEIYHELSENRYTLSEARSGVDRVNLMAAQSTPLRASDRVYCQ